MICLLNYQANRFGKGVLERMLADIVAKQRAEGFAGFRGAAIRGRLPVREAFLQPLLQQAVRDSKGLERLTLRIEESNYILVDVTVLLLFFHKSLRLQLRIDPVVDFAVSPLLKIHIVDTQGIPGFVLDFLLGLLPSQEGITITPRLITINLKTMLLRQKLEDFVPLVKQISLTTQPGCAFIGFHLGVD